MKHSFLFIAAALLVATPAAAQFFDSKNTPRELSRALAPVRSEDKRLCVQLYSDTSLKVVADELSLSFETLKSLNNAPYNRLLKKGSWILLPIINRELIALSTHLDTGQIKTCAPRPTAIVEVFNGDSVASIASRYGLTIADLRKLNPGVNLARLVIGSKIRVAKVSSGSVLAIRPATARGAGSPVSHFSGGSKTEVDTPEKQRIREQIALNKQREREEAERRDQERKEALLRRYKTFGECVYDWQSWGKSPSGVRSVKADCSGDSGNIVEVAVDCRNLKLNERRLRTWSGWKHPAGGQVDMVAEVCANVL